MDVEEMSRTELVEAFSPRLSGDQRRDLQSRAHDLHPVVLVGQKGVTEGLIENFENQILAHELIKVKVHNSGRIAETAEQLHEATSAQLAQSIGNILLFFKPHPEDPSILDPDELQ